MRQIYPFLVRIGFFNFYFLIALAATAQHSLLPNEEIVFTFKTQSGKQVWLNKDKNNKYIVYRYGTADKIDFQFPDSTKNSFSKFTYSFYLRGGGPGNEGMDLNYFYFINKGFKYVIYDTYSASDKTSAIGIKIIDTKSGKITNIKGNNKTRKGSLVDFRDNGLVTIGEEQFD